MKITMKLELLYDNEIQFYDACKAASDVLLELARKAIDSGDIEQFENTIHEVVADNGDEESVGFIKVKS